MYAAFLDGQLPGFSMISVLHQFPLISINQHCFVKIRVRFFYPVKEQRPLFQWCCVDKQTDINSYCWS